MPDETPKSEQMPVGGLRGGDSTPKPKHAGGRKVTETQLRFCQEYLIDLNATQAAIRAGYSHKTAAEQACRLLRKVNVRVLIERLKVEQSERTAITADVVLRELYRVGTTDVSEAFDEHGNLKAIKDIPLEIRRAIASVEILEEYQGTGENRMAIGQTKKLRFWDKVKALEHLGKHLGLFEKDNAQRGGFTVVVVTGSTKPTWLKQREQLIQNNCGSLT